LAKPRGFAFWLNSELRIMARDLGGSSKGLNWIARDLEPFNFMIYFAKQTSSFWTKKKKKKNYFC
jgi:hypothetical protein